MSWFYPPFPAAAAQQLATGARTITPSVGSVVVAGLVPGETKELKQGIGLGAIATVGQIPRITGFVFPGVGLVAAAGQIPALSTERKVPVGLGGAVIGGLSPSVLRDDQIGPTTGLVTTGGLAPSQLRERIIAPDVGAASIAGLAPTLAGDFVVVGTVTPDVGIVTLQGLAVTVSGTNAEEPRGHAIVKRRRGRRNYGQIEQVSTGVAPVLSPVPPAALEPPEVVDPPSEPIAALDTSRTAARLKTLESRRTRQARMRREEEELIAILMRAA